MEEEAEIEADNLQNSSTVENVLQRLQNFEVHWHIFLPAHAEMQRPRGTHDQLGSVYQPVRVGGFK